MFRQMANELDGKPMPAASSFARSAEAALTDMRSSAKWLLGAFAATGAVVFAGLQLTSLGNVNGRVESWRVPAAMAGFGLTVLGIAIAIGAIGSFLRRFSLTAKDLVLSSGRDYELARSSLADDPSILGVYSSVGEVWKELNVCTQQLRDRNAASAKNAEDTAAALNLMLTNALTRASLVISSRRYRRSLVFVAGGALVAAIGAGVFAVAVAQPEASRAVLPTVVRPLTTVTIGILPSTPERARIASLLGLSCDLSHLAGVVLDQKGADIFEVAVAGSGECQSAVLTLTADDAVVSISESTSGENG
jgi:hypothetical protein